MALSYATELIGASGDMSWLGSDHGIFNCRTSTVVIAGFDAEDHYPDGYLPSGLPVDVTDEANVGPWDGSGTLGFLLTDQVVVPGDVQWAVPILRHGTIRLTRLPVTFVAIDDAHFVFVTGPGA